MNRNIIIEEIYNAMFRGGHLLRRIGTNGMSRHCKYRFDNNSKNSDSLIIIVAGYQEYLWDKVFTRIKKYAPSSFDVCMVVPGQKNSAVIDKLSAICKENNWSFLLTAENKLALAQNKAIELHPNAENIFKLDEDIFISENYFEELKNVYDSASLNEKTPVGFVSPTLNVNGATYYKLLDFKNATEEYIQRFGNIVSACAYIPVWGDGEAAKFIWEQSLPFDPTAKAFYAANAGYFVCPHKISIGAIFFKRSFWKTIGGFGVAGERVLGHEETLLCNFCMDNSYLIIVSNKILAGHFAFGPQKKVMMEYYNENSELFE